jgi:hypothetical protein
VTVIQPGNTISVIVQYHVYGDSTLAFFGWPIAQPKDCYKISVKDIQIEFDAHIPARPTQVTLRNIQKTEHQQITLLERLFGEAFTHAMLHANRSGIAVMKLDLTLQNRRAIAQVQLEDACSPEIIQEGCATMLGIAQKPAYRPELQPDSEERQSIIDAVLHGGDEVEPLAA